jgi:hypothetical protein
MSLLQGVVGPQTLQDGATVNLRTGKGGDAIVSELHGRFYEQNYRGNLYSGGLVALTSINNATFTVATTGATATPIAGVWNPSTSGVNLVILQAVLGITLTALTAGGGGPFAWMASVGNTAITTGSIPTNRKTLAAAGAQAKVFGGTALTGMTGALAVFAGSALGGGTPVNSSQVYTVAGVPQLFAYVENIDGSIIVPPGAVVAIMATTTPIAHSAVSALVWEEVPV